MKHTLVISKFELTLTMVVFEVTRHSNSYGLINVQSNGLFEHKRNHTLSQLCKNTIQTFLNFNFDLRIFLCNYF